MIEEEKVEGIETVEVIEENQPSEVVETTVEEKPVKKEKKPKSKVRKILEWVFTGIFAGLFVFFAIGQLTGMIHKKDNYNQTLTYGYGAFVITTNSMEKEYKVGTAIITHKESAETIVKDFRAGKIVDITFVSMYNHNNGTYNYPEYHPTDMSYNGIDYTFSSYSTPTYPPDAYVPITHRLVYVYEDPTRQLGQGKYTFVAAGINIADGEYTKGGQYQLLTENELLGRVKVNSPALGGFFKFITSPWGLLVFLLVPAFYLVITSVLDIFKAIKDPEDDDKGNSSSSSNGSSSNNSSLDGLSDADRERLKKEMLEQMLNKKGGKK